MGRQQERPSGCDQQCLVAKFSALDVSHGGIDISHCGAKIKSLADVAAEAPDKIQLRLCFDPLGDCTQVHFSGQLHNGLQNSGQFSVF
jgi:hypothetical protein